MRRNSGMEYSPYKAAKHIESLKAGKPVTCHFLITGRCNYDCPTCMNKSVNFPHGVELSANTAIDYAYQLRELGVKALSISGGEPLVHRAFDRILAACLGMGFEIGILTNGSYIDRVNRDLLRQCKWIRISINSLSSSVFSLVHCHRDIGIWDLVGKYLPKIKSDGCIVGSSFLITDDDAVIKEIPGFAKRSLDMGFDTCRFSYIWKPVVGIEVGPEVAKKIRNGLQKASVYQSDSFKIFGLSERINLKKDKAITHCYYSDLVVRIHPDGMVKRCCYSQDLPSGTLGNLNERSLQDIWKNRTEIDAAKCPPCWHQGKNKFIEYLLHDDPQHVNFI